MAMSTQFDMSGLVLNLSDAQQNFRLLELPPELLESLALPDPPRLLFKSSKPTVAAALSAVSKTAANLHLCTQTQAYQVRQVSTSNSVYVLQPSESKVVLSEHDDRNEDSMQVDEPPVPSSIAMTAIAKTESVLELIPVTHDVPALLEHLLPLCDPEDILSHKEAEVLFLTHSSPGSKAESLAEIPAPDAQCEDAWRSLLAFELNGRIARAGLARALAMYKAFFQFITVQNREANWETADLETRHFVDAEDINRVDAAILESVLRLLNDDSIQDGPVGLYRLDRSKTVQWTGKTIIKVASSHSPHYIERNKLIAEWHDLLPARWARHSGGKLPEGAHQSKNSDGIEIVSSHHPDAAGQVPEKLQDALKPQDKKDGAAGKRKWHEKFKAQRKEVKN